MESSAQPVADRLLQAMAQAYPDPVDLGLLSMVMGCDRRELETNAARLVRAGLAEARNATKPPGEEPPESPCITDKGMAVADGVAGNAEEAAALLDRLEAATLRQLLLQRVRGSRLSAQQAQDLSDSLAAVSDRSLVDAASVWAHQSVSDWRALVKVMRADVPVAS